MGDRLQQPGCRFGHHLGVRPRAEHTGADGQFKVEERPAPAEVLQRLAVCPPGRQLFQPGGLFRRQRGKGQPDVHAEDQPQQLCRVEIGVGAARSGQPLFHLPQCVAGQGAFRYHLPSSGFSGRTGVTAAMATSIMLSSGSKTVRCCTQMPGWRMIRVAMLSDRPHHFSSS